ncbi:MAG: formate dehydrogenase subunit gamma [Alphaproteobacteria bacterium]|nr:formate dehydrogenase subunit gamma [Alphaproteobacteria bacterium]
MSGQHQPREAPEWDPDLVRDIANGLKDLDGALLPILHAVQERTGHVDARAVPIIAEVLNLSRAEVHGVVSFYHDFRPAPPGRHVVRLCRAEACQAVGADALAAAAERALGVRTGETSADGAVTLEAVYCLGNCALGPAALVDGELHGRLSAARLAELVRR